MIEQIETGSPAILGFTFKGKLHDADYQTFVPILDAAVATEGRVRLFLQFEDFQGWDLHAAWDDFKLGVKHYGDFDRIALVGDYKWKEWMAWIAKPFTSATVKTFKSSEVESARAWLRDRT